ncbi:diguanylate cyclase domain-containing protein [Culicoidibacter larvae]|uniref:Diguanylate cyclase n=1 Tax=Culicoidibacter larvae TaxID=2579976 RepID=A0A5R8Q982_9FIRM|nr:diguanylate cyclase [Culicoidibacter larvae]TLG72473.1 diguanylate cyclase [Culicoidibacter larvae]
MNMRKVLPENRLELMQRVRALLIICIVLNGSFAYFKFFVVHEFSWADYAINTAAFLSIFVGYFGGPRIAAVFGFAFVVWYAVWLGVTGIDRNYIISDYVHLFIVPLLLAVSSYLRRLEADALTIFKGLQKNKYFTTVDLITGLPNVQAFNDALLKQTQISKHYSNYRYGVVLFRIEFVDFIYDEIGHRRFNEMIAHYISNFRTFIHYDEEMFWNSRGELAILFPFGTESRMQELSKYIKQFAQHYKPNKDVQICLKSGQLGHKELLNIDDVSTIWSRLIRLTEEDVSSEYIR